LIGSAKPASVARNVARACLPSVSVSRPAAWLAPTGSRRGTPRRCLSPASVRPSPAPRRVLLPNTLVPPPSGRRRAARCSAKAVTTYSARCARRHATASRRLARTARTAGPAASAAGQRLAVMAWATASRTCLGSRGQRDIDGGAGGAVGQLRVARGQAAFAHRDPERDADQSASLNLTPARTGRSSMMDSTPASSRDWYTCSPPAPRRRRRTGRPPPRPRTAPPRRARRCPCRRDGPR